MKLFLKYVFNVIKIEVISYKTSAILIVLENFQNCSFDTKIPQILFKDSISCYLLPLYIQC